MYKVGVIVKQVSNICEYEHPIVKITKIGNHALSACNIYHIHWLPKKGCWGDLESEATCSEADLRPLTEEEYENFTLEFY